MRLSVITPVYNGEKYIKETIDSVIDAIGESNIEYLVVDDGSTDKTSQILKGFGSKIKVTTQVNQGESAAVNTGFNAALGDFVLVVSADDPLFTSEIFKGVEEYFDSNPNVVAWYPDWKMINGEGKYLKDVTVQEYSDQKLIGEFLCLPGPGTFIRKFAALQIGGRNKSWKYVGDYDFWLRISRIGLLERRPYVLAQWRLHDESTSIAQRGIEMYRERIEVIESFITSYPIEESFSKIARSHALYYAAQLAFFSPEIDGRKTMIRALQTRRGWIEGSRPGVVLYLLCLPFSSIFEPMLRYLLKKMKRTN
jgi:glycosyltransferase involved in cell wall biosynthesis